MLYRPIVSEIKRFFESGSLEMVKISFGLMVIPDFQQNMALLSHSEELQDSSLTGLIVTFFDPFSTFDVYKKFCVYKKMLSDFYIYFYYSGKMIW